MADTWGIERGERIGERLTAVRKLGGGKQHEVLLASDDRRLTTVVVKLLRPEQRTSDGRALLRQEAARLEEVRHPSFPRLLELVDDGDRPHLIMEHIEGPRLSRLVERFGHLGTEQLLPLAVDVAGALHYLHGLRLVHLDVKPSNLVVSDRVRIVDLGLARTFEQAAELTGRVGTRSWMAPEQHRPREVRVGPTADSWAWGASLLFAASGAWPLREARKEGGDDWRPIEDNVDAIRVPDWVPEPLASAIQDALSWRPEDRPSPAALARRLEPLVDVAAPHHGTAGRTVLSG